jgi:hypothetical protein
MKKNLFLILVLTLICNITAVAQTFEEYMKQQQQQYNNYVKEQQEGMQKLQQEYNDFVKKRNEEFAKYLEKEWTNYDAFKANKPVDAPKPPDPVKYEPPTAAPTPVKVIVKEQPVVLPPKAEQERPQLLPIPDKAVRRLEVPIDFFGQNLLIKTDPRLIDFSLGKPGQNEVARFWRKVTETNYGDVLLQMNVIKEQLNLNDWGMYQLINQFSARISPNNNNTKILYNWFLMTVSGFQSRLAYSEKANRLYLLVPSVNNVFGCQFLKFNGQEYYFIGNIGEEVGSVLTYDEEYGDAKKRMNLAVTKPPSFQEKYVTKKLTFSPDFPEMELNVPQNEMAFYATYPQTDFYVTMSAPMNPGMKEALMNYFGKYAQGKNPVETVAILLEFTQKAFPYKTDQAQFGYEKWDFPDEIFYYPFSDCDDRAALLSWLVYNIAGLDVIGILFPGHVSTAVLFPNEVPGDFVVSKQKKYTICDGTFIGAPVGRCMPQFAGKSGDIILRPGINGDELLAEKIWDKVIQKGGYPGEGKCDVPDGQGNIILTGWFDKPFTLGSAPVNPTGSRDLFVASFNSDANVNWVKILEGSGAEYVTGIVKDPAGNFIISGNFSGNFQADSKSIKTEKPEQSLFLLSMKPGGVINWLTPVFFDEVKTRENIYYQVRLDTNGKLLGTEYLPQQNLYWKNILMLDEKNNLLATGGFSTLPGMIKRTGTVNDAATYDLAALLKEKNDKLILSGYDKGIAGLFAVFQMLTDFESKLTGTVVQQTLDKYNPTFKTKSPLLYKSLTVVEFLKNSNGIVTLRTLDDQNLELDMLKVKNETNMKMVTTPEGDARIDFISGAKVGKAFVWFPLNSITVIKKTGDLIFDYAKDHSKANKNINKDILF